MTQTNIFSRFDPKNNTLQYRFDIYQYGHFADSRYFDDYEAAQKFFVSQYCKYESGERYFINNEEITFLEAYQYFDASFYNQRHWGKVS